MTAREIPPMTRREAYAAGLYTLSRQLCEAVTVNWTDEDWMRAVTYTVPIREDS